MPLVRELGIFGLCVRAMLSYGKDLHINQRFVAAQALALLAETEDFLSHRDVYTNSAGLDQLLQLKEEILKDLTTDFEKRKALRPLVDCIDQAKRLSRTK
jgi:hypothetical protein